MKLIVPILALLLSAPYANGQTDAFRKKHFNAKNDVALEGYDPISYFQGNPSEALVPFIIPTKQLPTVLFQQATSKNLRPHPINMNRRMADGALMRWAKTEKKLK